MPYRFINIDFTTVVLNATSLGALALVWFTEHMGGIGGFIVMLSIAYLNYSKGKAIREKSKNNESK